MMEYDGRYGTRHRGIWLLGGLMGRLGLLLGIGHWCAAQTLCLTSNTPAVGFCGAPGYACTVQRSTNLIDWMDVWTTNTPCDGDFAYADGASDLRAGARTAYYRVAPKNLSPLLAVPPIIFNTFYTYGVASAVTSNNVVNCMQESCTNGWVRAINAVGARLWIWIDDGWQASTRDSNGWFRADPAKFPSGLSTVVSLIHASNCLAGIYTSWGQASCMGFPGTDELHANIDMRFFVTNGFDGLKIDDCSEPWRFWQHAEDAYIHNKVARLNAAVLAAGRPIVLDLNCPGVPPYPWYLPYTANIFQLDWGIAGMNDMQPGPLDQIVASASMCQRTNLTTYDGHPITAPALVSMIGPGHYPRWSALTQFATALAQRAGLIFTVMTPQPIQTDQWHAFELGNGMTNLALLRIHQDPAGRPGLITYSNNCAEIWVRPLGRSGHTNAVAVVNWGTNAAPLTVAWPTLGLSPGDSVSMVDVFDGTNNGVVTQYSMTVPTNSVYLYRLDHP